MVVVIIAKSNNYKACLHTPFNLTVLIMVIGLWSVIQFAYTGIPSVNFCAEVELIVYVLIGVIFYELNSTVGKCVCPGKVKTIS